MMPDRPVALVPAEPVDLAAAVAAPPLDNLRRIGGEMFAWSDRNPGLPSGALLRHLLTPLAGPGRTVLVAGPHSDELVAALVDSGAEVSWLLRSLRDAEQSAQRHPSATVLAGTLGKLDPGGRFDLVVAADGTGRLNSAEGDQLPAGALLDRLAAAVRPDGALVLMHENQLGVHRTVRLEPGARYSDDSAWYPADEHGPASRAQLTERLAETGLTVDAAYAAFPEPAVPTVLAGAGILGDVSSPARPFLDAALAQAYARAFRDRPVLTDPRGLARRALRAGAEDAVAAGWLVIARAPGAGAPPRIDPHDVLIGDARGSFVSGVSSDGALARTTVLAAPAPRERGGLRRIAAPVAPVPAGGYLLEERLLELCAAADVRRLRQEISQFADWLRDGAATVAEMSDVLVTRDGLTLLERRWEPIEPVPVETALVRALWRFAVTLITGARPHPWPATSSAADLTSVLLGMAGRGVTEAELRAAVELQVRLDAAEFDLRPAEARDLKVRLLAVQPGDAPIDVAGYRELTEALWRQRYQASHLLAMMQWTEDIISSRDKWLSQMDWEIQFYRKSWAGRVLMLARTGFQRVRRRRRR
jgi:hypothetical protein